MTLNYNQLCKKEIQFIHGARCIMSFEELENLCFVQLIIEPKVQDLWQASGKKKIVISMKK